MNRNGDYYFGGMHMGWWFLMLIVLIGVLVILKILGKENNLFCYLYLHFYLDNNVVNKPIVITRFLLGNYYKLKIIQ